MKPDIKLKYYPGGRTHALTMSYDDGQAHDRRLVATFDKHGLKGTFHLNAGRLGGEGFVTAGELPELYRNHEISCHTYNHPFLTQLGADMLTSEVLEDRYALEAIAGRPVKGMSYPYGDYDQRVIDMLSQLGIVYSRTVESGDTFMVPVDFMKWRPSCHHNDGLMERLERFLGAPPRTGMPLMCVWGHSYEFDREGSWELIEGFCENAGNKPFIWYATMMDVYLYVKALRELHFAADLTSVYNPSALPVWISVDDEPVELPSGAVVRVTC